MAYEKPLDERNRMSVVNYLQSVGAKSVDVSTPTDKGKRFFVIGGKQVYCTEEAMTQYRSLDATGKIQFLLGATICESKKPDLQDFDDKGRSNWVLCLMRGRTVEKEESVALSALL